MKIKAKRNFSDGRDLLGDPVDYELGKIYEVEEKQGKNYVQKRWAEEIADIEKQDSVTKPKKGKK